MLAKTDSKKPLPPRFDKLLDAFIQCRDLAEQLEAKHKAEVAPVIRDREKIRGLLLEMLDSNGLELVRTDAGTVSVRVNDSVSCSDPEVLMSYIKETGALELLDRKPNKTACKAYADKHGAMPPGVEYNAVRQAVVRKPS